jgi:hypothetical protein
MESVLDGPKAPQLSWPDFQFCADDDSSRSTSVPGVCGTGICTLQHISLSRAWLWLLQARHFRCTECNRKLKTLSAMKNHLDGVHKVQLKSIPHAREGYDDPEIDCVGMEGAPSWFTQELTEKYGGPELQLLAAAGKAAPAAEVPAAPTAAAQPAGLAYPPGLGMAPQMHPGAPPMGGHPGQHPVPLGYGAPPGYPPHAYGPGAGYPMGGGQFPMPQHPGMVPYGYPSHMQMPPRYPPMMPPRPMMPPHGSIAARPAIAFHAAAAASTSSSSAQPSSSALAAMPGSAAATAAAFVQPSSASLPDSGPTTSNGYGSALAPPRSAAATGPGMGSVGLLSPNSAMPAPKPAIAPAAGPSAPKLRLVYDDEDLSPEERRAMLPRYKRT